MYWNWHVHCIEISRFIGSFGLSTKELYTIVLCPSSWALALLSVHTSPSHRIRHRNFIFGTHMHLCPPHMHIKYLVILTCILMYLFAFIHKRNNATETFLQKFMIIFCNSIYSLLLGYLNFMCFDELSCVFLAKYVPKCQMSSGPFGPIFSLYNLVLT